MNAKEFFDIVVELRKAQKEYFRSHTSEALALAKKLEKLVDNEIERVERVTSSQSRYKQLDLFGGQNV